MRQRSPQQAGGKSSHLLYGWQMEELVWKAFGKWLRKHRRRLSMSRKRAAECAKIDVEHWRRIEKGLSVNNADTIRRACDAVKADRQEGLWRCGLEPQP